MKLGDIYNYIIMLCACDRLVWRARPSSLFAHAKEEGSSKGHT